MSTDGREVWDWADKLSRVTALQHRARELSQAIRSAETTCGSCDLWMTPSCPRERHSNQTGRWTGPSMGTIKCDKFVMKAWDAKNVEGLRAELAQVTASLQGGGESSSERGAA